MKIRMLQTKTGAVDSSGATSRVYETGKKYEVYEGLAKVFLENGWAEEDKALDVAPETKEETPVLDRAIKASRSRGRRTVKK